MTEQQAQEYAEEQETITPDTAAEPGDEQGEDPDAEPEPQQQQAPQWSEEDEQEARLFGWKPPEEWQGEKPAGYIDNPEEYLGRVKRSRIFKTMQDKIEAQEQQQAEVQRKQEEMNRRALERQREQYEAEMQRLTESQRKAVEEADTESYDRIERQKQELSKSAPAAEQEPQGDPFVAQYAETDDGAWIKNPVLLNTGSQIINANPAMAKADAETQVKYAEQELRKLYPAYFPDKQAAQNGQQRTQQPAKVDGGGLGQGAAGQSSAFGKLPSDAKAQFKRFVDQGLYEDNKKDREEYANEYNAA